jgi:hypothetical protein
MLVADIGFTERRCGPATMRLRSPPHRAGNALLSPLPAAARHPF